MATIAQALQRLIERIELTESERAEAAAQHARVREVLKQDLRGELTETFLAGSYARHTALRPLHDIDFFAVLSDSRYVNRPIAECMDRVEGPLRRAFPHSTNSPRRQNRSVHIDFAGTGIGYDIVPAVELRDGIYQIPDQRRGGWIKTAPQIHENISVERNRLSSGKMKPLIKLCKLWNRKQGKVIGSFHLEVLAYSAFDTAPLDYASGLVALFEHIAQGLRRHTADPARVGPNIDEGMSDRDRETAIDRFSDAARRAARARDDEDHDTWRELLGSEYSSR